MDLPESLKSLRPYLQHAKQVGNFEPLLAYYCRYYAVQMGTEIMQKEPSPETRNALIALLEKLEGEKKTLADKLKDPNMKAPYVLEFANKIYDKAEAEDQDGKANKATALSFYAASIFYDVMKQFGDIDADIQEKQSYAKWKASDISSAIKAGRTPRSGSAHRLESMPVSTTPSFPTVPADSGNTKKALDTPPEPLDESQLDEKTDNTKEESEEEDDGQLPITYAQESYDHGGCTPEQIDEAYKYARYAVSSLQFEDEENAIVNLTRALQSLGAVPM